MTPKSADRLTLSKRSKWILGIGLLILVAIGSVYCLPLPENRHLTKINYARVNFRPTINFLGDKLTPNIFYRVYSIHFDKNNIISSSDVESLRELPDLERVNISFSKVTDEKLALLGQLKGLTHVTVVGLSETDGSFIEDISHIERLETLMVCDSPILDSKLKHLARAKSLKVLSLSGCPISDAGIAQLVGLSEVRNLNLRGTKVTDSSISYLIQMPALEELWIGNTNISEDGKIELKKHIPVVHGGEAKIELFSSEK